MSRGNTVVVAATGGASNRNVRVITVVVDTASALGFLPAAVVPVIWSVLTGYSPPQFRLVSSVVLAMAILAGAVLWFWLSKFAPSLRVLLVVVGLALVCTLASLGRFRDIPQPDGHSLPDVERRISAAFKDGVYDVSRANRVSLAWVSAGEGGRSATAQIMLDIIWSKYDPGVGERVYRGRILYEGSITRESGVIAVGSLRMTNYSIVPSSGVAAYVLGFVEIDWAMRRECDIFREPLERTLARP